MKHLYPGFFTTVFATIILCCTLLAPVHAQCPISPACTPGAASNSQAGVFGMGIFNVTLGTINNSTTGTSSPTGPINGYQDYSCTQGTTLNAGLSYPISIQTNANSPENVRVWLDWNNDGVFNPVTELFFSSSNARQHTGTTAALPLAAVTGQPLRLRVAADAATSPVPTPCSTPEYSQVEDYRVTLQANTQPPAAAFALNTAQACTGTFAFTDQSLRQPTTWRWTFGDGTSSTAQSPSHAYTAPGTYTVRLRVCNAFGCDSSQQTAAFYASYPATANCQPATLSYCCNYGITRVDFGNLSQISTDGRAGYEDFSCTQRATVAQGQTVALRVTTAQPQDTWVYLDANNDGSFTAGELLYQALNKTSPQTFLVIPRTLLTNQPLRLRIISDAVGSTAGAAPCANRTSGQVEDYTVVVAPAPCPTTVQGGRVEFFYSTGLNFGIDSVASALLLTRYSPGATIQWERSPAITSPVWQALPGHTGPTLYYKRLSTQPDSLYRAVVTCGTTTATSTNTVRTTIDVNSRYRLHTYGCSAFSSLYIRQVRLGGTLLDNSSTCGAGSAAYQLFSPALPTRTATVLRGETYELEVSTTLSCRLTVFADTPDRLVQLPVLRVPATVAGGATRLFLKLDSLLLPANTAVLHLRIRCDQNAALPFPVDYTTELTSGETEDYLLRVVPFACAEPVASGRIVASTAAQCVRDTARLTLLGITPGSRLQWQRSTDSLTWQSVPGQTGRVFAVQPTTTSYYRVLVQGCATTATTPVVRVRIRPLAECYCGAPLATVPSTAPVITRVRIMGTTLDNTSLGTSGGPGAVLYSPSVPSRTAELVRGATYLLQLTVANSGASANAVLYAAAWLDLNRNGNYDSLEWVHLVRTTASTTTTTYQVPLPVGVWAGTGPTGLRLRVGNNVVYRPSGSCAASLPLTGQGETEEYTITIIAPPCAGTLTAGTVDYQSSGTGVCRSRMRSTSYTPGAELQWQISPNGQAWTDIAGATADEYTVWANYGDFYRLQARCTGTTVYSPVVQLTDVNSTTRCGCATTTIGSTSAANAYVDDVEIVGTTLVNVGSGIQEVYTSLPSTYYRRPVGYWAPQTPAFTATLLRGSSYPLRLAAVGGPGQYNPNGTSVGAWIDWNHNGTFESTEFYGAPSNVIGRVNYTTTLTVPATAPLGATLMRVRAAGSLVGTLGCGYNADSETEEYIITIADQAALTVPLLTAAPAPLCLGATLQLGASGAGTGARYDWLGPAGFTAANTASPTRGGITAAHGGTYIAVVTRNGQRLLTSVYVPVDTCHAVLATRAVARVSKATIYPNPTTGRCTVVLPLGAGQSASVLVRNTTGQLLSSPTTAWRTTAEGMEADLDLSALPQGLYLLEMRTERGSLFGKVVRE